MGSFTVEEIHQWNPMRMSVFILAKYGHIWQNTRICHWWLGKGS